MGGDDGRTVQDDEELRDVGRASLSARELRWFVKSSWPIIEPAERYKSNWHIDATSDHLEAVTRGEITRLIINIPPRYGKSTLVSVGWPVWEWLQHPSQRWIFCSYKLDLSRDHSLKRRAIIQSDWFQYWWGRRIRLETDQELKLTNTARGMMLACAVGAPPHGKGGKRVVIDDPHDPEQAESELERDRGIRFYRNSLYPRLDDKVNGAIVVVMQRLNQADLTGQLLDEGGWVHLKLPGRMPVTTRVRCPSGTSYLREAGSALWPGREDEATLDKIEREMTPGPFAGQYGQEPVPPGGYLFQRSWFPIVDHAPPGSRTVRYWDKAATHGGGAYTAGVKMRKGFDGYYYIIDVVRGQWSAPERERVIRQTAALDGTEVDIYVEREGGGSGKESNLYTILSLPGYVVIEDHVTGTGDKTVRARPLASFASVGDAVRLVKGEWNKAYLDEIEMFPNGRYKDQVDASGGAFNKLKLEQEGNDPAPAAAPERAPLYVPGLYRRAI